MKAGKLENVKDPSGLTVDGLQEFYDEACLAVLNNKWADVYSTSSHFMNS